MNDKTRSSNAMKRPIVLVVEPSILARLVICDYLRDCEYQVLEASNTSEAIVILDESGLPVDVILSEVQLPGEMDGFTFARYVRQKHPHIRMLLAGTVAKAAKAAAEICEEGPLLAKPYDQQLVLDRIKRLMASADEAES